MYRRRIWLAFTPPQLFIGSFLLLILGGTVGFMALPGLYTGARLGWLDALFTATSAVCVTGLIVVDTATYFTTWGQAYILALIQLGGLGIITFTSVIMIALGLRLSLRHESLTRSLADIVPAINHRRLTRDIFLFTFSVEAAGALFLYLLWVPDFGMEGALWPAVFHSISAFCNAGFSTFSDSLIGQREGGFLLSVIMGLIVLGGLGFIVIEELWMFYRARVEDRSLRLSLHSRVVLYTTGLLLVGGWLLFAFFEWELSLETLTLGDKLVNSLFMSVTARTAGFNTIDYFHAANNTDFLTILLMAIGGSPGSMAGGMKTTTFALIGILAWTRMRGRTTARLGTSSIREEAMQRAVGLFVVVFAVTTAGIFVFSSSEFEWAAPFSNASFLPFMFEAASAFNTVGLSMGVTPELSNTGRVTTILLMFLGRVGPLTFAAALARQRAHGAEGFRFAYQEVGIG